MSFIFIIKASPKSPISNNTQVHNFHDLGLKVAYLEGNAVKRIEGLDNLVNLRSLYLQENLICKIEGLECLINLVNLNLSDNQISVVEGLKNLTKLQNLQIKRNRIGGNGIADLQGLLECPTISALDISDNHI